MTFHSEKWGRHAIIQIQSAKSNPIERW